MCVLCVRRARGTSSTSYKIGGAKSRASESDVIESTNDSSARPPPRDQNATPSGVVLLAQISAAAEFAPSLTSPTLLCKVCKWLSAVRCILYSKDTRALFYIFFFVPAFDLSAQIGEQIISEFTDSECNIFPIIFINLH